MSWHLPSKPTDPRFEPWQPFGATVEASRRAPGLYLIRSKHLATHAWGDASEPAEPWRGRGVIYVGISLDMKRRLEQFAEAASSGRTGYHSGGYWFHHGTRTLEWYRGAPEDWREDLEFAVARPTMAPPQEIPESNPRWVACTTLALESVEAALVADVMAHRLSIKCPWHLLNHVDRTTYPPNSTRGGAP